MTARYEIQYKHPAAGWQPHPVTLDFRDKAAALRTWAEIARHEREQLHLWRLVAIGVTVIRQGRKV